MLKPLSSLVLVFALLAGCMTQVQRPDGSIETQAVDLDMVRMMASTSVAAWAAATNGIKPADAKALANILDSIAAYHADGSPIVPQDWNPVIQRDVPPRYQGLAVVMLDVVAYQLRKYDLSGTIPTPDSDAWKVLEAIQDGARRGLAPYINPA